METTTSTTQTAPTTLSSLGDVDYKHLRVSATDPDRLLFDGSHGYCSIYETGGWDHLYTVYIQTEGKVVRLGRDLTEADAIIYVNTANDLRHNGWEV
jgi:hypothetical protein